MININGVLSYVFSDRNGNVQALFAADSSEKFTADDLLAEYEYDPFGNMRRMQGPLVQANPIRFSTQYYENISGLYSYIFRHYYPTLTIKEHVIFIIYVMELAETNETHAILTFIQTFRPNVINFCRFYVHHVNHRLYFITAQYPDSDGLGLMISDGMALASGINAV